MSVTTALEPRPSVERVALNTMAAKRRPRIWTCFATYIAAAMVGQIAVISGFVLAGVCMGFTLGVQGADSASIQTQVQQALGQPLPAMLLSLIPFQLGMGVVVLLAARQSKDPFTQRLGLAPQSGNTIGASTSASMAGFTLSLALTIILGTSLFFGPPPSNPIASTVNDGSWWAVTLLSVVLSLLPALVEETVFRGYIQRRLLLRWSPAVAIGITTCLFALLHADSVQHILAVVPLGVITGMLAYRTNSIWPGVMVHAVHNAGAVGFGVLVRTVSPIIGDEAVGALVVGVIAVTGLIGLPAIVSLVRRSRAKPETEPSDLLPASGALASLPS